MSALDFREQHGDPNTWTTADFETFEHLAETDPLPDFTLVMVQGSAPFPIPTNPAA